MMVAMLAAAVALPSGAAKATELEGAPPSAAKSAADAAQDTTKLVGKKALDSASKLDTGPMLKALKAGGAKGKVKDLVSLGARSGRDKKKDIRDLMAEVKDSAEVADGLCEEANTSKKKDHGRTVVALGLLGEMRNNKRGVECMSTFVDQALPTTGTVVDGDILERVVLEQQMMKAVDGLAFSDTADSQAKVLKIAGGHESRAVRAEAIGAYLEAHGNTDAAKKELEGKIKAEDKVFLDRLVTLPDEKPEDFNKRLDAFLAAHPELVAQAPEKRKGAAADEASAPKDPPKP